MSHREIYECKPDEHGRCAPCAARFEDVMTEVHTHECHRGDTQSVSTPLGFRFLRLLRKFLHHKEEIAMSIRPPKEGYQWSYIQTLNKLKHTEACLEELEASLKALQAKYDAVGVGQPAFPQDQLRPGDPRRNFPGGIPYIAPSACCEHIHGFSGDGTYPQVCPDCRMVKPVYSTALPGYRAVLRTAPGLVTHWSSVGGGPVRIREECPLEFLYSDLAAIDRLLKQTQPGDTLSRHSLTTRRIELACKINKRVNGATFGGKAPSVSNTPKSASMCPRCLGKGRVPPWEGSNGLVDCPVCRPR